MAKRTRKPRAALQTKKQNKIQIVAAAQQRETKRHGVAVREITRLLGVAQSIPDAAKRDDRLRRLIARRSAENERHQDKMTSLVARMRKARGV